MKTKSRNAYYDIVKGIAIYLVVLCHVMQTLVADFETNKIVLAIYAFHMPLFMMVSGKFFLPSIARCSMQEAIKKKIIRLYLPSVVWGAISVLLVASTKILRHMPLDFYYFISLLFTGMWFLTVLFLLSIAGIIIEKRFVHHRYLAWGILFVALNMLPDCWMRKELIYLLPYFVISIALCHYKWEHIPVWTGITALVVFSLIVPKFEFGHTMYHMTDQFLALEYHSVALFRFCAGISGSIMILFLCQYIIKAKSIQTSIAQLGTVTLPIYVLHKKLLMPNLFINYHTNNYIGIAIISLIVIAFSLLIYAITRKSNSLSLLLFGESKL